MRILIVVVYYPPSTTSAAQMMRDLALEYVRLNHQVIVVTPCGSAEDPTSIAVEDGVTVIRVKTGNLKNVNRAMRMWRESRLSATIWRAAQETLLAKPCDLIVFYSPTIFFGKLVRRLKSMWGCPAYLILRDIFPRWAVEAGMLREGMLYRYLKRKEREQYAAADIIGVEAPGNLPYFAQEMHNSRFRVEVLYNWMNTREQPKAILGWRKKLGLEDKVVFFYGGNIGKAQDIDNILRLAAALQEREDMFFLLVGSGSEEQRIGEQIRKQELRNIRMLPPLPQREYMECLSEFDVGLVSLDRRLTSHNFTGKLLGYVLCGKPILASLNPGNDLMDFLHRADAGIACPNGEDERLRAAALLLATQPEVRRRMGRNARSLGDTTFSVQVIAKQILAHCDIAGDYAGTSNSRSLHAFLGVPSVEKH